MSTSKYTSPRNAALAVKRGVPSTLFHGDCKLLLAALPDESVDITISSPPYCIGKVYEAESTTTADFIRAQGEILPEVVRVTKDGGSICWQTGYHITNGETFPLDFAIYDILKASASIHLRNRIIWSFGHGLNSNNRFSGRHEVVLWFTKGEKHQFNLDAIRVPQKYPGKRHYKGLHKGELSGNPLGKNPGDVWEMPNVNANHIEKTSHPCQFPVALAQRLIRALAPKEAVVLDPFMGSGSSGVASELEQRRFLGAELRDEYMAIAQERIERAKDKSIRVRELDKPIYIPDPNSAVAKRPDHFFSEV